jgi:hypothetical protein
MSESTEGLPRQILIFVRDESGASSVTPIHIVFPYPAEY